MVSRVYKYQWFNEYNNKKKQGLEKCKGDSDSNKYIFFFPTTLFFCLQKESNYLFKFEQKNIKFNLPNIYIKKLLVREVLNLQQSFQVKKV